MPANYPVWVLGTPHTDRNAHATEYRHVSKVPAIQVDGATYRGSQPMKGVFELVDSKVQRVNGEDRYEVYCAWFGVKPPTKYPRIQVSQGTCKPIPSYTGEVIDNISA